MYPSRNPSESWKSSSDMKGPVRLAGTNLGDRAHICAFFNSREEAYRVLLPFVKEGLDAGEKAVHTVDPRQREEHRHRLALAGIDVAGIQRNDQLELRDWTNTHLANGKFDPQKTLALFEEVVSGAKESGFPLVRFVTQMEWALETDLDLNDLLEYEARANDVWLRQTGPVNPVICTYDLKRFRGDIVVDVMRTHPLIIVAGILQENPFFVPPDEFLEELHRRGAARIDEQTAASQVRGDYERPC